MKSTIIIMLFYFISLSVFSQDLILRKNGEIVDCKITKTDSTNVYFTIKRGDQYVESFLDMQEIKDIKHKKDKAAIDSIDQHKKYSHAFTIGILNGGGSLIGFDYEVLLTNYFGIQAGAGIIGYGCGLNLHFKPTIKSSFLSLQYWHQGLGDGFVQSLIGPNLVLRANKIFQCQLGLGAALNKGPNWPTDREQPPVMLTYAIGIYFPTK